MDAFKGEVGVACTMLSEVNFAEESLTKRIYNFEVCDSWLIRGWIGIRLRSMDGLYRIIDGELRNLH
jgi:uncharacterized protein YaiL (DUF2058 family)